MLPAITEAYILQVPGLEAPGWFRASGWLGISHHAYLKWAFGNFWEFLGKDQPEITQKPHDLVSGMRF